MSSTDPPIIDDEEMAGELGEPGPVTESLTESARALASAGGTQDTLALVLSLAVTLIAGCDCAGLFVRHEGTVRTPLYTDPVVLEVDALQHRLGEGPCLSVLDHGLTIYAGDLAQDPRWSSFGRRADAVGVRSALALPLLADDTLGALNLYARNRHAFSVIDRTRALVIASFAGMALSAARTQDAADQREADLQGALASREIIGQAQGILIERNRITADQAFDVLRRASQHMNLKLREVAQTLIDTGEEPGTTPRRT